MSVIRIDSLSHPGIEVFSSLTEKQLRHSFEHERGVLCAMRRPLSKGVDEVCHNAHRVVVIDGVVDAVNVGAMFRSAAAAAVAFWQLKYV